MSDHSVPQPVAELANNILVHLDAVPEAGAEERRELVESILYETLSNPDFHARIPFIITPRAR